LTPWCNMCKGENRSFRVLSLKDVLMFSIPALIYFVNNNLNLLVLQYMDAAAWQLLSQLKIVFTAILFRIFLQRELTIYQWLAVWQLSCGAAVSQIPAQGVTHHRPTHATGGYASLAVAGSVFSCFLSAAAGVANEKMLKEIKAHVMVQNFVLYSWGIFFSIGGIVLHNDPSMHSRSYLSGFNNWAWVVVFSTAFCGLSVSAILKYLDNMVRCYTHTIATLVTMALTNIIFHISPTPQLYLAIAITFASTVQYNVKIEQAAALERALEGLVPGRRAIAAATFVGIVMIMITASVMYRPTPFQVELVDRLPHVRHVETNLQPCFEFLTPARLMDARAFLKTGTDFPSINMTVLETPPDRSRSCAVVGSGSSLTLKSLGAQIDKHATVIRMNHHRVSGFEADVGTRTDIRMFYPEKSNLLRPHSELPELGVVVPKKLADKLWLLCVAARKKPCQCVSELLNVPEGQLFKSPVPCTTEVAFKRLGLVTDEFSRVQGRCSRAASLTKKPSLGFSATVMALAMCSTVDLYGMYSVGSFCKYDYRGACPPYEKTLGAAHDFVAEHEFYRKLNASGLIRIPDV